MAIGIAIPVWDELLCQNCQKLQAKLADSEKTNFKLIESVDKAAQALKILSRRVEQLKSANFKLLNRLAMCTQIDRNIGILR